MEILEMEDNSTSEEFSVATNACHQIRRLGDTATHVLISFEKVEDGNDQIKVELVEMIEPSNDTESECEQNSSFNSTKAKKRKIKESDSDECLWLPKTKEILTKTPDLVQLKSLISPLQTQKKSVSQSSITAASTSNYILSREDILGGVQNLLKEHEEKIQKYIESAKRSILYDLKLRTERLFNNMPYTSNVTCNEIVEKLDADFPIKELESFIGFDEKLKTEEEIRKSFISLIKIKVASYKKSKDVISDVLSFVMSKNVQLLYSGCGKIYKGTAKKNFSATEVFKCLTDVLEPSFKETRKDIVTQVSKWLAIAGDRDGGRKQRLAVNV